jgi:hypothetical protein
MATCTQTLHALPVAVHSASRVRQGAADLARFEAVVDATDAAVASSKRARRAALAAADTRTEGETTDALSAVLAAIAAVTNAATVPPATGTKRELVRWTLTTIKDWREVSERTHPSAAPPGMDPGACMELVARLNGILSGTAPA